MNVVDYVALVHVIVMIGVKVSNATLATLFGLHG